ncbi:hypothetical protein [Nonomuraea sp. NPDC003804]|uniref:hypothetical protein n=1 Tax=Nonomuraea sp. NPDC003804 TaxID=3154547 RepID=UPI0033A8F59D
MLFTPQTSGVWLRHAALARGEEQPAIHQGHVDQRQSVATHDGEALVRRSAQHAPAPGLAADQHVAAREERDTGECVFGGRPVRILEHTPPLSVEVQDGAAVPHRVHVVGGPSADAADGFPETGIVLGPDLAVPVVEHAAEGADMHVLLRTPPDRHRVGARAVGFLRRQLPMPPGEIAVRHIELEVGDLLPVRPDHRRRGPDQAGGARQPGIPLRRTPHLAQRVVRGQNVLGGAVAARRAPEHVTGGMGLVPGLVDDQQEVDGALDLVDVQDVFLYVVVVSHDLFFFQDLLPLRR